MKNLQEMKGLMLQHWDELNRLVGDNPEMLKHIQDWGARFVEEKVIFYNMINEVKDELIDKSQEIQEGWNDIQTEIGKAVGMVDSVHGNDGEMAVRKHLEKRKWSALDKDDFEGFQNDRGSGIETFVTSLNEAIQGFNEDDINVEKANAFLERLNALVRDLAKLAYKESFSRKVSPIEKNPGLEKIITGIQEATKEISRKIKEASKIYMMVKKIRDTHFLKLYNEGPQQQAA